MKITSILTVDAIEPSLEFWVGRLGFVKTVEVPDGDKLAFVILQKGDAELMFQTHESIAQDAAGTEMANVMKQQTSMLFIEVDDFDDTRKRLGNAEVLVPERVTFYGMREIFVKEPGGHVAGFAAKAQDASAKAV